MNLGRLYARWGKPERARELLLDCLAYARSHHLHKTTAKALLDLARLAYAERNLIRAREQAEQARRLARRTGASRTEKETNELLRQLALEADLNSRQFEPLKHPLSPGQLQSS